LAIGASAKTEVTTVADGSTTTGQGDGVGVAVAINATDVDTRAIVQSASLESSGGITISAENVASKSVAEAKSGASGSTGTGVAGSLAINVGTFDAVGGIQDDGAVDVNGSDITLSAKSVATNEAKATAAQASAEGKGDFGMGASVALNIGEGHALATTGQNTGINNAANVTLKADNSHATNTLAEAGGKSAGTGVGGAVAITVADGSGEARVDSGSTLAIAGALTAEADNHGVSTTKADGEALGGDTAVGAAIALGFVTDNAVATTARNINAGGAVTLSARGDGSSKSEAIASAAGGKADDKSSADAQIESQAKFAGAKSGKSDLDVGEKANTKDGEGGGG